ncbi:hypothetical protein [Hafnia sp.]|uniref:hypothetical protein n=1 Tax=Hafnia sp. TaxID=1873498 RepID=UPI002FC7A57D
MNQEKLDCLEKRAIDAKNHIHADIQKTKSILSNLPPFLASSKVREGVEKDQQHQLNTCALITDLIHALKENNQPIHSTSIIGMDFAADIAEFTFGLNQPVAIIASGEGVVSLRALNIQRQRIAITCTTALPTVEPSPLGSMNP